MSGETTTTATSLVELIDQLVPPPEPAPVSMVPQTAGWIVLAMILVVALAVSVVVLIRRYRANAYRRAALVSLKEVGNDPAAIAGILRRTALAAYPRPSVAGLAGTEWLAFLDASLGEAEFQSEQGQLLLRAPYYAAKDASPELSDLAARWIKRHKPRLEP